MRARSASGPEPRVSLWHVELRESVALAAAFWLATYATLTVWAILVTEGVATPVSLRRLATTAAGALFYWLTIRLHAAILRRATPQRIAIVLAAAGGFCLLLFAIRLTIYQLFGGTQGAEIGNNVQWLLMWAGYFLAGIGVFASRAHLRALAAARAAPPAASTQPDESDFWVDRAGASLRVPADEILWFEAEGNYVRLHGRETDSLGLVRATLASVQDSLAPGTFVRVHRSALCRASAIRALRRLPSGATVAALENGAEVPVGRSFRPAVDRILGRAA